MKMCSLISIMLLTIFVNVTQIHSAAIITGKAFSQDIKEIDSRLGFELIQAIKDNNVQKAEKLIRQGADVDFKTEEKKTPLMQAILLENKEMVELLLNYRANINAQDRRQDTPLIYAIESNRNTDIARLLISKGANIEKPGNFGDKSPLMIAISSNKKDMVILLLDSNAELDSFPSEDYPLEGYRTLVEYAKSHEDFRRHMEGPNAARTSTNLEIIKILEVKKRQLAVFTLVKNHLLPPLADIVSKYDVIDYADIAK